MLSIVILTCKSRKHIQACLDSIFIQDLCDTEVIVVDNASADGTKEWIRERWPRVRLIENQSNLGASKARNQGIELSSGEWVLALDSDVVLENGFIEKFNAPRSRFAGDMGMVQPNVLNGGGKTIYSQGIYLSLLRRFFDLNRGKPRDFVGSRKKKIIGPCSAAAFYRRSMLEALKEKTGYFDERFFFLVEDADLAWRAKRAGWKVLFDPRMVCFHTGNSSATNAKLRQYLSFRNRHWMIAKNESFWGKIFLFVISLPYELARIVFMALFNKYLWTSGFRGEAAT